MVTPLTLLTSKDVHYLQPLKSLSWAERQVRAVKDAFGSNGVTVKRLAEFWGVSDSDIIQHLSNRSAG